MATVTVLNLDAICELPARFHKRPGIPLSALLSADAAFAGTVVPSVDVLERCFDERPELIQGWLDYSADKWPLEGWYFRIDTGPLYHVFHKPYTGGRSYNFPTLARACAEYLVREIPGSASIAT